MRKNKNHTHQASYKMTKSEYETLMNVNEKLFGGTMNTSDLMRFLVTVALDKLASANVVTKRVVMVDGVPVVERTND